MILARDNILLRGDVAPWPQPDLSYLGTDRRPPPFPLNMSGSFWAGLVDLVGQGASAPPDYVGTTLLTVPSTLLANVRRARAGARWSEPAVLGMCLVGSPGSSTSPAQGRGWQRVSSDQGGCPPEGTDDASSADRDEGLRRMVLMDRPPAPPAVTSASEKRQMRTARKKLAPTELRVGHDTWASPILGLAHTHEEGWCAYTAAIVSASILWLMRSRPPRRPRSLQWAQPRSNEPIIDDLSVIGEEAAG